MISINKLITIKQSDVFLKIKENMSVSLNVLEEKIYEKIVSSWDNKTGKFSNIYEILYHKDSLVAAYIEFSREKGVTLVSGDLISLDYKVLDHLEYLSRLLKDNSWKPSSLWRFNVFEKDLTSSVFSKSLMEDDKIVISAVTKILSILFEGSWLFNIKQNINFKETKARKLKLRFLDRACEFRSFYGDHRALNTLLTWGAVSWFIDVDIQYSFKNIYQKRLLAIIKEKVEDVRLLDLLNKFFNNSVINLQFNREFGFFQGILLSNLLVNIYWNVFDKFIVNLKKIVDKSTTISNISGEWKKATWVSLKELNYVKSSLVRKRLKRKLYREKVKQAKGVKLSRYISREFEIQKFVDYRMYYVRYGVTNFDIKLFFGLENSSKTEKIIDILIRMSKLLDQKNKNYSYIFYLDYINISWLPKGKK